MSVNVYTRTHSSFVSNWQFNWIELNGSNKPVSVLFRQSERDSSAPPFRRWNVKCIFFWNVTKVQISRCRREACRRKIRSSTCTNRTAMRAVYPNVHTLIKSMLTTSCTTASVEHAVYQDGGVTNILAKSLRRRTIELQLLGLLFIVMWKWITRNQYRTCAANNIVNCSILKRLF